ncbi:coagulation factor VIIi isoform X2 [Genypterus blacodes]|uniref:coagulation factor VIIi isoform X2 n=1 Tax=Genypterus blacodes TaxID=154954 RepID=UPI003F7743FC
MLLRSCCTVWILSAITAAAVFVQRDEANGVLQRRRRANSFMEELKRGNLERECVEEICDYEEAREVFEDDVKTKQFWQTYNPHDPCRFTPCQNNGTCVSTGNSFQCRCPEGYEGRKCQIVFEDSLKCLYQNGGCQHFCNGSGPRRKCSCADGYMLGDDGRGCVAQVEYPCGRLAPQEVNISPTVKTRVVGSNQCPPGNCPWQVLVQYNGRDLCGGVLVDPDWVITAAHCIHGNDPLKLTVVAGEHNLDAEDGTEQRIPVSMAIGHDAYIPATGDSDVALLRLSRPVTLGRHAVPVCLPTQGFAEGELLRVRYHTVSGWGKRTTGGNADRHDALLAAPISPFLRRLSVPILQNSLCSQRTQFNFTDNMLCAGYLEGQHQGCRGDDGSPLVTLYGSTHFLMGVVGWGRGCGHPGYYDVYTNMANFVDWVGAMMKAPPTTPVSIHKLSDVGMKVTPPPADMMQQKVV